VTHQGAACDAVRVYGTFPSEYYEDGRTCYRPAYTRWLLSTHADRQDVDISLTVCNFVCLSVRLRISPPSINVAASNFVQWFIGIPGNECPILENFAPQKLSRKPKIGYMRVCNSYGCLIIRVERALADLSSALATRRIGMCG